MNKILQLFDENYVKNLFEKEVLPLYPDFAGIKKINIYAYKKNIWENTYHVVVEFKTDFITNDGKIKQLPIFCSAHSDEPRKNVYDSLKFLWESGFGGGYLTIPHPLFYSDYFSGTFYRGVEGNNLYYYIREGDREAVEVMTQKAAAWFAKLHKTPISSARNFNKENSRIETVFPGVKHILHRIKRDHSEYFNAYEKIYNRLIGKENNFLNSTDKRWLVHGDAHPENIIKVGKTKIAVIDFTDLCLSDFTRDLGAFLQQLEYMSNRKIGDTEFTEKIKKIFLDKYFKLVPDIKMDDAVKERINNYYYWTMMRTITYFLIKDIEEPERAKPLIEKIFNDFNI
ncbi:hypothetical protein A2331_05315 [Candidatus Falkowbacteria bacterium RIFOXYB2_FULL_34_18]|uniref:Aminoglycoside phosphotransferase domain-containing protein n=1 Tax=Candidatus Falkowbacteria bacterium RIFOXYD2_FULL_34_120 TaxID=1798007 RepID=A0A1F5TQW0_9BACT|nr:MAG: hypothetical protein A2331_05315 [Candidatus Falkowbacteria bacterium RIFOXYB2_FULL_34_18]OGF29474.1 MAG: hypothetical protein A2500_04180 [Candidatus Falkowbacteria bacterium RIFOXYC12_FULL_34_55]OGF36291.1 MAG: hypothetical protein A2466_05190 [Candidatus Falkowbacteria bacterium RIFOXYC2_FULL_34_220]OGF39000.1 MAG: hypothetical protein A2515_06645 [Candidatus Falkowbacteria bacterium RIFOXYD12_FULL_34_57]OGF41219.1 MAG: hypothetical protein A2531_00885 [Candidatus Falkowbacteria bact